MNKKNLITLEATVHIIHETICIERKDIPNIYKKLLTIETFDGQILYPELTNKKILLLKELDINVKDKIRVGIYFRGSEKNDKRYNNIYISTMKKI